MARRPKGSGSIYALKDGTVVGQYEVDTPNGKKRKYIRGKSKKDVASELAKAVAERDSGLVYDSQNLIFSEYLDRWLSAIEGTIREGSWKQYEMLVRVHINPALGDIKLEKLTALHVQDLYRRKLEGGLSHRRVLYIHTTLHKALDQAVRWLLIPRNVTSAVEMPKITAREIEPLTEVQAKRLLAAARGDRLEALYVLAVTTGMRQGELLGLKWSDVDLQNGVLRVNRTVFNGTISPPKTKKSRRTIKLSEFALAKLLEHRKKHNGSEWVFSTRNHTPFTATNPHKRSWKPLLRKAGLPSKRFHDLRHTCASILLSKNIHPKIVSDVLGHGDVAFTLSIYSHLLAGIQDRAADAMDEHFDG